MCFVTLSVDAAVISCFKEPDESSNCVPGAVEDYSVLWSATCGDAAIQGVSMCAVPSGSEETDNKPVMDDLIIHQTRLYISTKSYGYVRSSCYCRVFFPQNYDWVEIKNMASDPDNPVPDDSDLCDKQCASECSKSVNRLFKYM